MYVLYTQSNYDVPKFVGEFSFFGNTNAWSKYLAQYDELGWGWTIWSYKIVSVGWWDSSWGLVVNKLNLQNDKDTPIEEYELKLDLRTATFDELMRSEEYLSAYIFECDGEPCGFGLLNITYGHEAGGRVVWIEEIYIREEYRGRGLGREFFEYVFANIPAARYRLEVEPENERAVALYEKLGFEVLEYGQMVKDR